MDTTQTFTADEQQLIEYAKEKIVAYNTLRHERGGIDTLYSFVLSDRGNYYDGASFEPNLPHAGMCAERLAIANLVLKESYQSKIKSIVVADPVPKVQEISTPPCGTCRHLIWSHGSPETSVLLVQYIQTKQGWIFPKIENLTIAELYPHPYQPNEHLWDNWKLE